MCDGGIGRSGSCAFAWHGRISRRRRALCCSAQGRCCRLCCAARRILNSRLARVRVVHGRQCGGMAIRGRAGGCWCVGGPKKCARGRRVSAPGDTAPGAGALDPGSALVIYLFRGSQPGLLRSPSVCKGEEHEQAPATAHASNGWDVAQCLAPSGSLTPNMRRSQLSLLWTLWPASGHTAWRHVSLPYTGSAQWACTFAKPRAILTSVNLI